MKRQLNKNTTNTLYGHRSLCIVCVHGSPGSNIRVMGGGHITNRNVES